jgi:hypothetical protein
MVLKGSVDPRESSEYLFVTDYENSLKVEFMTELFQIYLKKKVV